jgi:selenocysteine-specific elongation factor
VAPLTLGTAGHIDHGKTALVAALTGVDTDRLPQEKARGISIELGYAALDLPSGRRLSVVDVPGHERFVRTMVAGATGIDLYLLAIAADDGVMPQTREHAAVLSALGVGSGVVAVTKADLADPGRAISEAGQLLPGALAVAVSVRSGEGLDDLRRALDSQADGVGGRGETGAAVLHVDRVFTIHGAGTVVTGTLWSGTIARGDELLVLPAGRRARVRGVQVHDVAVERAGAGQRVAVNLVLGRDEVARGDVLVGGGDGPRATFRLDARLDCSPGAGRVMVHHGTREAVARAVHLGGDEWQLRLEAPLVAAAGDRLVVRAIAPPDTLGGGVVVDPAAARHRTRARFGADPPEPEPVAPLAAPSLPPLTDGARLAEEILRAAGHEPPLDGDLAATAADLAALRAHGRAVRVGAGMHFHADALAAIERRLLELLARDERVTLAGFRDELGTSRKYAQALLEHFDQARVTLRVGDERIARRKLRTWPRPPG